MSTFITVLVSAGLAASLVVVLAFSSSAAR